MKILFLAADRVALHPPDAPAAGVDSLPKALAALGHDVRVARPAVSVPRRAGLNARRIMRVVVPHVAGQQIAAIDEARLGGVTHYLLGGPAGARDGRRSADDAQHVHFSLAALSLCRALDWAPDILHAQDWRAGPAIYWLSSDGARDNFFQATATVFSFRGLQHARGGAARGLLAHGLTPSDSPLLPDWARDSLLALGLAHADALATGSPTYAREAQTAEFGYGLEGVLQARADCLAGISDGLDPACDPATDPRLRQRFDARSLERRAANKRALQQTHGLRARPTAPLLAYLPDLEGEPGVELAAPAVRQVLAAHPTAQFVALWPRRGSGEASLTALERAFPERAVARREPDPAHAARVLGGADILLLPSRGDPGSLAAVAAQRCAAVPVAHQAGALADAVVDQSQPRRGSGFVFTDYNAAHLTQSIERALAVYRQPERWRALQQRGMQRARKFTWANCAQAHLTHYQLALTRRKEDVARIAQSMAA